MKKDFLHGLHTTCFIKSTCLTIKAQQVVDKKVQKRRTFCTKNHWKM